MARDGWLLLFSPFYLESGSKQFRYFWTSFASCKASIWKRLFKTIFSGWYFGFLVISGLGKNYLWYSQFYNFFFCYTYFVIADLYAELLKCLVFTNTTSRLFIIDSGYVPSLLLFQFQIIVSDLLCNRIYFGLENCQAAYKNGSQSIMFARSFLSKLWWESVYIWK